MQELLKAIASGLVENPPGSERHFRDQRQRHGGLPPPRGGGGHGPRHRKAGPHRPGHRAWSCAPPPPATIKRSWWRSTKGPDTGPQKRAKALFCYSFSHRTGGTHMKKQFFRGRQNRADPRGTGRAGAGVLGGISPQFLAKLPKLCWEDGRDAGLLSSRVHKGRLLVKLQGVDTVEQGGRPAGPGAVPGPGGRDPAPGPVLPSGTSSGSGPWTASPAGSMASCGR